MECSDWGRADSIAIIIMVIGGLFLGILVLYIVRFGYKGAPTLLENVLVIVLPTILVILFIYRRISYREPNGKKPWKKAMYTRYNSRGRTYSNL